MTKPICVSAIRKYPYWCFLLLGFIATSYLLSKELNITFQRESDDHLFSDSKILAKELSVPRDRNNHFVYVKIEKTGSSTFSNIFSSYGYRHNLNMMMSTISGNLVNTRELEPGRSWNIGPDSKHPHVMEQHARYNHTFYTKIFPPNTVYITSLRDPVRWFISYVDFMPAYQLHDPKTVLSKDKLFYKKRHYVTGMQRHVHNTFLQWLGFDVYQSDQLQHIKAYIDFIDQRFILVMFTEYFDESLVLLKRLMNWSMADIFYTFANEAKHKSGTVFTEEERRKLLDNEHNAGDWLLYQHFNKTFWEKVGRQFQFYDEVKEFKKLNARVQKFCFSDKAKNDKSLKITLSTRWEKFFEFGGKDCLAMRVIDGEAEEFSQALDAYCPFRSSKTVRDIWP